MVQHDNSRAMDVLRVGAFLIPAIIALTMMVVGGWHIDQYWGVTVLCTGFFGMFSVGIGKWQESSALSTYGFSFILCAGLIWTGSALDVTISGNTAWRFVFMTGGGIGLLINGIGASLALQLNRLLGDEGGMVDAQVYQLKHIHDLLEKIHDNSMITESTKRVLHRDLELTLLRRKIDDLIARGDYDAGLDLCETIEKAFDSSDEADMFRHRILRSRQEHHEAEIHGAMEHFDHLLQMRDWAHAHQEAARIRRLFPDSDLIGELDNRIHAARSEHKQELLNKFQTSMDHDNVESAMKLLRELDRYLTREEATQLSLQAQSVVERHRENLSTRFKIAVNDRRWTEAIQIGDLIRREFPNTKMAEEVDSMIDVLQTRATEAATPVPPVQN